VLLLRIKLLLVFFAALLFADLKIFATKAVDANDTLQLQNPVIFYNGSIIQAKKGLITKDRKIILKDNVVITYKNRSAISADSLIAYSSRNITMKDIFFYNKDMDGWIVAKTSKAKNNKISFKRLYFSTCCIEDPDWFLKASRASFDKTDKSLELYHLMLVINDVPVFYLPYFYINFDKTRRSGLLRPYVGYSENEGLLYSQPIYFVTSVNTDLEITPTFRTLRGKGVYTTFRFVDSPNSKGIFKFGYFKDNDSYFKNNNLANQLHFGYSFLYNRTSILHKNDALYLDLKYANDVDYFYLDAYNYKFNDIYLSDKLITSTLNYILPYNDVLYGLYTKYFIDTTQLSNDATWQILPEVNIHKFLNKTGGVLNSFDFNIYNYYRVAGSNYLFTDISMPVSYNFNLFNKYLYVTLTETLNAGYGFYYQESSRRSYYTTLSTRIKFYNSLTKTEANCTHIISPSLTVNLRNYKKIEIYSDLINVSELKNYVTFNLYQYLEYKKFLLTHTLNQTYYLSTEKFSELENILNLSYGSYSIDETNKYSYDLQDVTYNNIKFSYNNSVFNFYLYHVYQKDTSKSVTVGSAYSINKYKKLYGEYSFDLIDKYTKYWLVGIKKSKKCWHYDLNFKQSRIPVLEENGITYKKDNILNISFELVPIGGLNQTFVFKGNK